MVLWYHDSMGLRAHKPALQTIFDERVASIYYSMAARVAERRSDTGVLLRAGRALPFTRDDLYAWVLQRFVRADLALQCSYCNAFITVQTFVLDHRTPIAPPWYGSLGLENLALCCASCNRRKGRLSESGFRCMVSWGTRELDPRDFADILGRLA